MTFLRNNAIALAALFIALGGTSYAATQIGSKQIKNNSVTGKDIRNKSLTAADLKPGTLLAGPAGAAGAAGPAGAPGPQGERGPSEAWLRSSSASVPLGNDDTTILSVDLPAGDFIVNGAVRARNGSDTDEVLGACTAGNFAAGETGFGTGAGAWDKRRMIPVTGAYHADAPSTLQLKCRRAGGLADLSVLSARLTVVRVATLDD